MDKIYQQQKSEVGRWKRIAIGTTLIGLLSVSGVYLAAGNDPQSLPTGSKIVHATQDQQIEQIKSLNAQVAVLQSTTAIQQTLTDLNAKQQDTTEKITRLNGVNQRLRREGKELSEMYGRSEADFAQCKTEKELQTGEVKYLRGVVEDSYQNYEICKSSLDQCVDQKITKQGPCPESFRDQITRIYKDRCQVLDLVGDKLERVQNNGSKFMIQAKSKRVIVNSIYSSLIAANLDQPLPQPMEKTIKGHLEYVIHDIARANCSSFVVNGGK